MAESTEQKLEKEFKEKAQELSEPEENIIESGIDVTAKKNKIINPDIDKRFRIEEKGSTIIYRFSNDEKVAFKETESKLTTTESSPVLVKSMLQVAEDNGWSSIKLKGTDEFKRQGWLEASLRGMEVKGYKPTEQDLRHLEDQKSKLANSIETDDKEPSSKNATQPKESETSLPPISIEGKAAKAKELKEAMATLEEKEAIEKYPELAAVYKTEPAAVAFYRQQGGLAVEKESEFVRRITDKVIEEIAAGKPVPTFNTPEQTQVPTQKVQARQKNTEIDFD